MNKKNIPVFLTFLALIFISACSFYPSYEQVLSQRSKIKPVSFDKEEWFDDEGIGVEQLWEKRPAMARDLVNRNLLIGKSSEDVTRLLGKNEKDKFGDESMMKYIIFEKHGVVDPVFIEYLTIYFDDRDKVSKTKIEIVMMDGHPDYR